MNEGNDNHLYSSFRLNKRSTYPIPQLSHTSSADWKYYVVFAIGITTTTAAAASAAVIVVVARIHNTLIMLLGKTLMMLFVVIIIVNGNETNWSRSKGEWTTNRQHNWQLTSKFASTIKQKKSKQYQHILNTNWARPAALCMLRPSTTRITGRRSQRQLRCWRWRWRRRSCGVTGPPPPPFY